MNERIKELAGQAKVMAEESINMKISATNEELYAFAEEFSELIVRECTNMVEEHQPRYLTRRQAQEMADTIREHFGVWE